MKRVVQQKDKSIESQEIEDIHYVIADIKIIYIMTAELGDPYYKIVNSNKVDETYQKLLLENGLPSSETKKSYKKYLRQLILENVENISFEKSLRMNEPDWICSETAEEHALDVAIKKSKAENFGEIFKAAKSFEKN